MYGYNESAQTGLVLISKIIEDTGHWYLVLRLLFAMVKFINNDSLFNMLYIYKCSMNLKWNLYVCLKIVWLEFWYIPLLLL